MHFVNFSIHVYIQFFFVFCFFYYFFSIANVVREFLNIYFQIFFFLSLKNTLLHAARDATHAARSVVFCKTAF